MLAQHFPLIMLITLLNVPVRGADTAAELLARAREAADRGARAAAERLAGEALAADPDLAGAYYFRGRQRFLLGRSRAALRDFDRYIEQRPQLAARQWERGIACYYAGQYAAGARQFERYQTFHSRDVENSIWRFSCMVPDTGTEAARAAMLPIQRDPRGEWMMRIYDLYRGRATPAEVLAATRSGAATPAQRAARKFYADLYVGLYHDVHGSAAEAARHIQAAADEALADNRHLNRYMWEVARIHAARLRDAEGEAE